MLINLLDRRKEAEQRTPFLGNECRTFISATKYIAPAIIMRQPCLGGEAKLALSSSLQHAFLNSCNLEEVIDSEATTHRPAASFGTEEHVRRPAEQQCPPIVSPTEFVCLIRTP